MANLILVGSKDCSSWDVTRALRSSPAFPLLWEKKSEIANSLGVDTEKIWNINQDCLLGKSTWSIAIYNLLVNWVGVKGSDATLGALANTLKQNNLECCAEFLLNHFLMNSRFERKFQREPTVLSDFKCQEEKNVLILLTLDIFITCEKIRENYANNAIFSFKEYLKILSGNQSEHVYPVVIANDLNGFKTILKQRLKRSTKLVLITYLEFQKEAEKILSESCCLAFDRMDWNDLSPAFQNEIEENAKKLLRKDFKYEGDLDDDLGNVLCGQVLVDLINNHPLKLVKPTLPPELPYYVKRELSPRNIIRDAVLQVRKHPDIFVVSGMGRAELSICCKSSTGDSTTQCALKVPSARFIILDSDEHFQTLCIKFSERRVPVHWLKRDENGRLRWIRSEGNVELMHTFMDSNQDNLSEETLAKFDPSGPICVSDSPGMGKSILLAKVGRRLAEKRTVVFLSMRDFIMEVKEYISSVRLEISAINAMINLACLNELGKLVLNHQLSSHKKPCLELILDGLDEVDAADIDLSFQILQVIKAIKSIRLWVSTRPHLLPDLENLLGVPGFKINPFKKENQVEFLIGYWSRNHSLSHKRLKMYIDKCLKSIHSNLSSEDKDIVGIPLQCYMIGVIFEKEAVDFCKSSTITVLIAENGINSIANLYDKLIQTKLAKYPETFKSIKYKLINTHVYYSLRLIFPEVFTQINLGKILDLINRDLILKAGILEASSPDAEPTFIHRTFAEYFVALFVTNLLKGYNCRVIKEDEYKLAKFIYEIILKTNFKNKLKLLVKRRPFKIFAFANQAICYFFNSILADELDDITVPFYKQNLCYYGNVLNSLESIQAIIHACIFQDFFNIYNYFQRSRVLEENTAAEMIFVKDILHFAIQHANLEFIKSIFITYENVWNIANEAVISKIVTSAIKNKHVLNPTDKTTALFIALKRGKYTIVEYLINEKDFRKLFGVNPNLDAKLSVRFHSFQLVMQSLGKPKNELSDIKEELEMFKFLFELSPDKIVLEGLDLIPETQEIFKDLECLNSPLSWTLFTFYQVAKRNNEIRELIEYRVESDCVNKFGETHLHIAAKLGLCLVVKLLIEEEKMDVNVQDSNGLTPRDYAKHMEEDETRRLIKELGGISGDKLEMRKMRNLFSRLFRFKK